MTESGDNPLNFSFSTKLQFGWEASWHRHLGTCGPLIFARIKYKLPQTFIGYGQTTGCIVGTQEDQGLAVCKSHNYKPEQDMEISLSIFIMLKGKRIRMCRAVRNRKTTKCFDAPQSVFVYRMK